MNTDFIFGSKQCGCTLASHPLRRVVLTGGPGAGKTAVLEMARKSLCHHAAFLPESASLLFGGGFPRILSDAGLRAAQRAIFRVQSELERLAEEDGRSSLALCDRGTIDGLAYWPDSPESYFAELGTTLDLQLARYTAVIHLRTPAPNQGYNHQNELRIESAREAHSIDERVLEVWKAHPRRFVIDSSPEFLHKASHALALLRAELPECCRAIEGNEGSAR